MSSEKLGKAVSRQESADQKPDLENSMNTMEAVFTAMRGIDAEALRSALDAIQAAKKEADPTAGIFIAPLGDIVPVEVGQQLYRFYAARVLGKKDGQPFVTPHLHQVGDEPYVFKSGSGEMNIGVVVDGKVVWREPVIMKAGDQVLIQEGEAHSFRNLGDEPTDFAFACPDAHLVDNDTEHPKGDRYVVRNLPNGIPVHFGV